MLWKKKKPLPKKLVEIKKALSIKKKPVKLFQDEQLLLKNITQRTIFHNTNNITRTKAYLDFYKIHPEIHWSFLAHMVSRNGGWNMTDLRGEFLMKLLSEKEQKHFFAFLECANWLIFQDAYPQLLLFEESLNRQKNLFHLLPHLGISAFMETLWNHTWEKSDTSLITNALIINEQNYIEKHLLYSEKFATISDSLAFLMQDVLSLNHILFPSSQGLVGLTVHHFEDLQNRIEIGKKLYNILYTDPDVLQKTLTWAVANPHTGSRKDYWPHVFNTVSEISPGLGIFPRLEGCQIRHGLPRFYSPTLTNAWKNQKHVEPQGSDWFTDLGVVEQLLPMSENPPMEIQSEYCQTLHQLELASIAKKFISFL